VALLRQNRGATLEIPGDFDDLGDELYVLCLELRVSLFEGWFKKFRSVVGVDFVNLWGKVSE
jgi:hypothetical protein